MRKRRLGQTGLEVTEVGFGGIPIQHLDAVQTKEILDACLESGMNFIDTARGYTVSESFIGEAIEGQRDQWIIATKSTSRDYEGMKADVAISLSNLRTDYIDLYQFHFVKTMEDLDKILSENGAYKALLEAKAEGKIGHIGITSHSVDVLSEALDRGGFETIQFPYNPVESQGEAIFERAKGLDIGVILMKPIAGGAIRQGEISIKYVLNNPNVTVAIPGMDSVDQVRKNSAVGKEPLALTKEDLDIIREIKDELDGAFCRRCNYCAPCSQGIDIPLQFVVEGYLMRYHLEEWAYGRYSSLAVKSDNCIQCGVCETRCPYDLPIGEMMKRVSKNFKNYEETLKK
ncbi:MAG: aldo/keto reductase [Clostridia bacterium]|nr:aldo/keto reductase [Clostridia bacterium]